MGGSGEPRGAGESDALAEAARPEPALGRADGRPSWAAAGEEGARSRLGGGRLWPWQRSETGDEISSARCPAPAPVSSLWLFLQVQRQAAEELREMAVVAMADLACSALLCSAGLPLQICAGNSSSQPGFSALPGCLLCRGGQWNCSC